MKHTDKIHEQKKILESKILDLINSFTNKVGDFDEMAINIDKIDVTVNENETKNYLYNVKIDIVI